MTLISWTLAATAAATGLRVFRIAAPASEPRKQRRFLLITDNLGGMRITTLMPLAAAFMMRRKTLTDNCCVGYQVWTCEIW